MPFGHWIVADRQHTGRGRLGRTWFDGYGNFMGSTALLLEPHDPPAHTLALVTACAVRAALDAATGGKLPFVIKWPNDILIGDAKLAGILLEREGDHLIVGVGINITSAPELPDRKTTCLAAMGSNVSRDELADKLTAIWPDYIAKWRGQGIGSIVQEWMAYAHPLGTKLRVAEGEYAGFTGEFNGLMPDGALRLLKSGGEQIIIHAGDVALYEEIEG
jgi:BirA family transcriptional regulator, biotin operon repressor / biotin---[acetyl-CoA-carboxylase] ligase